MNEGEQVSLSVSSVINTDLLVAALLLKWGIDEAAKDGYPLCLDATVTGKPLYERMGFVAKKENVIDLRPFGVDHTNQVNALSTLCYMTLTEYCYRHGL